MVNKVRIGFAIPDFRCGGAENVIISIANYLGGINQYEVFFLVGEDCGYYRDKLSPSIKCITLGSKSGLKSARNIALQCNENHLDVVVGTLGMAHGVAISRLFGNKSRLISRIGNTISEDLKRWTGLKRLLMTLYQHALLLSDKIIVQSDYMGNDTVRILGKLLSQKKIVRIYNPIETNRIYEKSREMIDDHITTNDIVTVGRLEPQKSTETIIRSFAKYKESNSNSNLYILGDGIERHYLESLALELNVSDSVIFKGRVSNPFPYIKNCGIFVMASLYEGFSNAILEAVALGKFSVVSDCPGGNKEIIRHGENGLFFPVMDVDALCKSLVEARDVISNPNSDIAADVDCFKMENIITQYEKTFR